MRIGDTTDTNICIKGQCKGTSQICFILIIMNLFVALKTTLSQTLEINAFSRLVCVLHHTCGLLSDATVHGHSFKVYTATWWTHAE